jgi:hypothetical protein
VLVVFGVPVVLVVTVVVDTVTVGVVVGFSGAHSMLANAGVPGRVPNWSSITTPGSSARGHLTR